MHERREESRIQKTPVLVQAVASTSLERGEKDLERKDVLWKKLKPRLLFRGKLDGICIEPLNHCMEISCVM
jgi:hypothetical protein